MPLLRFLNSSPNRAALLPTGVALLAARSAGASANILGSEGASAGGSVAGRGEEVERGLPESWLREVVRARPQQLLLGQPEAPAGELPY